MKIISTEDPVGKFVELCERNPYAAHESNPVYFNDAREAYYQGQWGQRCPDANDPLISRAWERGAQSLVIEAEA